MQEAGFKCGDVKERDKKKKGSSLCWTGGGDQEGLMGNLFLVGPSTVWRDDEDEREKKNELQTDGGGVDEEEDAQDGQWEGVKEREREE